jgi:tRNA-2-methylthio-N6-dimethylallyladenosine synthase
VDPEVAHDRLLRLQAVITRQQREAQESMVGRVLPVLFEKPGRQAGQMTGKSEHLMAVSVTGPETLRGEIMPVRITAALTNSLSGSLAA